MDPESSREKMQSENREWVREIQKGIESLREHMEIYSEDPESREDMEIYSEDPESREDMEIYTKDPKSEVFILLDEIMSLRSLRRELLSSLTPGLSVWKSLGQPEVVLASNDCTRAPVQKKERESAHEQLGFYTDSILQDMDDLVNRMLSMAYVVVMPVDGAALSTYMADELVNSTSSLKDACTELYIDSKDARDGLEDGVPEYELSDLCYRFLQRPLDFENKLILLITKEEEEDHRKEVEKERKEDEKERKQNTAKFKRWQKEMEKHDKGRKKESKKEMENYEKKKQKAMEKLAKEHPFIMEQHEDQEEEEEEEEEEKENLELDRRTMEYLKKAIESSEIIFTGKRDCWNTTWGSKSIRCGDFQDKTTLSSMHFTHTIQSSCRVTGSTLEIYSFKILKLKEGLKWPLKLYGMVAARDTVDHNRNIVFSRSILDYQELEENESCLCLTGPSRAIAALDNVEFEVELKIKEGENSQGKELMTLSKRFVVTCGGTGAEPGLPATPLTFENKLCKAVLNLHHLSRAVQATIVGVCVKGDWPFEYGCRVACSALDQNCATAGEVVLLDCRGGPGGGSKSKEVRVGSDGYLHLSRNVVSVQSDGTLRVVICSYRKPTDLVSGRSDIVDHEWVISFPAQEFQTIEEEWYDHNVTVKVVVAWSLLVKEKLDLLVDCPAVES